MKHPYYLYLLFFFVVEASFAQSTEELNYSKIDSLLVYYQDSQQLDKGIALAIEVSQQSSGVDSIYGKYLDLVSFLYQKNGDYANALDYSNRVLQVFERSSGKNTIYYLEVLMRIGLIHFNTGQYDKALPYYMEAKDISDKEQSNYAIILMNIGVQHNSMGNYDEALPYYIEAKDSYVEFQSKDDAQYAIILYNLAELYGKVGDLDKSLMFYVQAKDVLEKIPGYESAFTATLRSIAATHCHMENYDKALPLANQTKEIIEKTLGKDNFQYGAVLSILGMIHQELGNKNKALPFMLDSKRIIEKTLGKTHPEFATAMNNLSLMYQETKQHEKALPLLTEVKDLIEKTLGRDNSRFVKSLSDLAAGYKLMNEEEKALELFIEAKNIGDKVCTEMDLACAVLAINLATLYGEMEDFDKAWAILFEAMDKTTATSIEHTFDQSWLDQLQGITYYSNAHLDKMIRSLSLAYELFGKDPSISDVVSKQKLVADLANALLGQLRGQVTNEKDKLRMLSKSTDWLDKSLSILDQSKEVNKAFNISDQNKSVLLLQATKSDEVYRLGELPDSLVDTNKNFLKKKSTLEAKLVEDRSTQEKDSLRNELNQVNQNIDFFIKRIEKEYPRYHKLKYQQVDAKVEEIQQLLDDHTALLEYVIADSVVHIFIVDKKEVQWYKFYVANKVLKKRIQSLHDALSEYSLVAKNKNKSYEKYIAQAHWFYLKLVAPALKDKAEISNLIVVTDGALGHLPFETFLVKAPSQVFRGYGNLPYLINDYNISYNYSATLWKENVEALARNNNGQILGVAANYAIKLDASLRDIRLPTDQWRRDDLITLPAARKEVQYLKANYQGFFVFDELASEKVVKENAANFAILHLATHGLLDAKRPVLSSLAMTEDSDPMESNFWQAHEISKIQLNADLVVLSACETGFGEFEKGNGIASLARAFMYAGAPALIVSLWQVNDYTTSEIMKNLYENLANGMKKDAALKQAKIQYIATAEGLLQHPAFWSPFILIGKNDPVNIQGKGAVNLWLIGGASLLLILGGGFMLQKRKRV